MKPLITSRSIQLARLGLITLLLALVSACATTPGTAGSGPAATAPEYEIEPWEGDGMDIPLDGSSQEAFQRSLARVKAHTSETNYITLTNAIEFLLFYELAVKRDRDLLAENLDGLNGHQVIERVEMIRAGKAPEPRLGRKPGETEA